MGDELGDRLNCFVSLGCTCLGAPLLILGVTALHSVCDLWGHEDYFSTWSLLDSTLVCCNASCPAMVLLDTCSWVGHNTSGEYGNDCVVGHEPPFKWCWSDKRCGLGNYNNVGLAIVLISFGALFSVGSVGLALTGMCPKMPIIVKRVSNRYHAAKELRVLRDKSVLLLLITKSSKHRDRLYALPPELQHFILEYFMCGPYDKATIAVPPVPTLSAWDTDRIPAVWRDPSMSLLINNIVTYVQEGTPCTVGGAPVEMSLSEDAEGAPTVAFSVEELPEVRMLDVLHVLLLHGHVLKMYMAVGEGVAMRSLAVVLGDADWEAWVVVLRCFAVCVEWGEVYTITEDASPEEAEVARAAHLAPRVARSMISFIDTLTIPFTEHQVRKAGIEGSDVVNTSILLSVLVSRGHLITRPQAIPGRSWLVYLHPPQTNDRPEPNEATHLLCN